MLFLSLPTNGVSLDLFVKMEAHKLARNDHSSSLLKLSAFSAQVTIDENKNVKTSFLRGISPLQLCYLSRVIHKFLPKRNAYSTHETFLKACLEHLEALAVPYQVLEFGTGGRSSEIISNHIARSKYAKCVAFESNAFYLKQHQEQYSSNKTQLVSIDASNTWFSAIKNFLVNRGHDKVGLVFLDSAPWESRTLALSLLSELADFVMVHDVDYFPREGTWGGGQNPDE